MSRSLLSPTCYLNFLEEDSMYSLVIIKLQKATVTVKSSEVDTIWLLDDLGTSTRHSSYPNKYFDQDMIFLYILM